MQRGKKEMLLAGREPCTILSPCWEKGDATGAGWVVAACYGSDLVMSIMVHAECCKTCLQAG